MSIRSARLLCAAAVLAGGLLAGHPAVAEDDDTEHRPEDYERARAALEAGHIRPLAEVLKVVSGQFRGEIVAAEFEDEDDRWIYEVKLIDPRGRLMVVEVDAATATILAVGDER